MLSYIAIGIALYIMMTANSFYDHAMKTVKDKMGTGRFLFEYFLTLTIITFLWPAVLLHIGIKIIRS